MKIRLFHSINEIAMNDWKEANLDFALSDGIYEYALYNQEYASYDTKYIEITCESIKMFCIAYYFCAIEEMRASNWYKEFLIGFFGEEIINEFQKKSYNKICLVLFPREIDSYKRMKRSIFQYVHEEMNNDNNLVIYSSFKKIQELEGFCYEQKPYMYFDIGNAKTLNDYLEKQSSKVRHVIRNDRRKLRDNDIVLEEINCKEHMNEIQELNAKSVYKMPESLINMIPLWEEKGLCRTIAYYKDKKIVQFLSILVDKKVSYTIAGNINEDIKKWSGVMNNYSIFIENSILMGASKAYIGYECINEKIHRGAIPITKYLYVPKIKSIERNQ